MFICPTHPSRILTMLPNSSILSVTLSSRHLYRPARNPLLGRIRGFSTAKMPKKEFLCLLPDKPNVLEQRKIAGPLHHEQIKPQIASGTLVVGGGMYEEHPVEGKPARQTGSMIIYAAESVDEVWEVIRSDAYTAHGVWDLDKVQVIPYVSAVRTPMIGSPSRK